VNFNERTVLNYSGNYFDRVVLFNRKRLYYTIRYLKYPVPLTSKQKLGRVTKDCLLKFINVTKKKGAFK
jgi:hypothetical protein